MIKSFCTVEQKQYRDYLSERRPIHWSRARERRARRPWRATTVASPRNTIVKTVSGILNSPKVRVGRRVSRVFWWARIFASIKTQCANPGKLIGTSQWWILHASVSMKLVPQSHKLLFSKPSSLSAWPTRNRFRQHKKVPGFRGNI